MSSTIHRFTETKAPTGWTDLPLYRTARRPRILLADDHDLLLDAFRRLLEPEFNIVRGVSDGEALVEAALALRPDAVLCDISMPRVGGLEALRRVHALAPGICFIMLTMHADPALAAEALNSGAAAYVLKTSPARELLVAIHTALRGREYVCPSLNMAQGASAISEPVDAGEIGDISPRGREVLRLLAGGRTMKETAARLGITPRTVAFHKYRIMQQLSLRSSAELVQFAVRSQIV